MVKKLKELIPELTYRYEMTFFPERCLEAEEEEGTSHTYWMSMKKEVYKPGVSIRSEGLRGGGVVRLTYKMKSMITGLGKDSKKAIQDQFQDLDPDLRITSLWTSICSDWDYFLHVYIQYSPVKK